MRLKTGHFMLDPLLDFARNSPQLPRDIHDPWQWRECAEVISTMMSGAPADLSGWYWWGRLNEAGWETVYLGMTRKRKTSSLYARLKEEMLEEGTIAIWADVWGKDPIVAQHDAYYGGRYHGNGERSLRKCGSRMVLWVGILDPISEEEIVAQKGALIRHYEPVGNYQQGRRGPANPAMTDDIVAAVTRELGSMVKG